jgi:hypothetical protein
VGHKQAIKDNVRSLRLQGVSLDQIKERTGISKSTISTWIRDIILSKEQQKILRNNTQTALQEGRKRVQGINKKQRLLIENELLTSGKDEVGGLNKRELLIAGIALYWGEGFKNRHEHRLGFCNSDPSMIKFYLHWLDEALEVKKEDLVARLTLNDSYTDKEAEIKQYWSQLTNIPLSQFTKTFYQRAQWKRVYNTDNYHGVLRIHVKGSLNHLLKMKGWIEGLRGNLPG